MKIWFDMDGTIADLYAVEDWLPKLRAHDARESRADRPHLSSNPTNTPAFLARLLCKTPK